MISTSPIQPWPRRPARLATAVIEDLVDRIVTGVFPASQNLPTEPALCEAFGVSRSVLREAVKAVESMGLVKVQQGHGTTALPQTSWDMVNPVVLAAVIRHDAELSVLDNLIVVRRALEMQMASAAAGRVTDQTRSDMDECLAELDRNLRDADGYAVADVAFHDVILTASGNLLGRSIVNNLTVEAYQSMRYIGTPTDEDRRHSNEDHRRIRDAVARGDASAAGEAMDQHIADAWKRRRPTRHAT